MDFYDDNGDLSLKKMFLTGTALVGLILTVIFAGSIFETNQFGNYQIKQAAVSGDVTVRNDPDFICKTSAPLQPTQYRKTLILRKAA